MARTGLRMMPTSPSPPLKFRTAGFPRYGFKASMSDRAFLNGVSVKPTPGIPSQPLSLSPSCAHFGCRKVPGSVPRTTGSSMCRCSKGFRLSTPGVLGSGSSYAVSFHHGFLRPHPSVSQARCDFAFAYTQRLRCAGAPRRPARPSLLLRLCFPCMSPTLPRRSAVPSRCTHTAIPGILQLSRSRHPRYRLCQQYPTGYSISGLHRSLYATTCTFALPS
jgi:hypothetical protein